MCSRPPKPVVVSQVAGVVAPLAPLLGTWQGVGQGKYPTIEPFEYVEETTFSHVGKPFIEMRQKTWHPASKSPMHTESGYLRMTAAGSVEMVLSDPTGLAQVYAGTLQSEGESWALILTSTAVLKTPSAKEVTQVVRTLSITQGVMHSTLAMAAVGQPLQDHLDTRLTLSREHVVSVAEARTSLASYPLLLDVREAAEVAAQPGLPHARHVPLGQLLSSPLPDVLPPEVLPPQQLHAPVLVYCRSGRRAALAVESLQERGVSAVSLAGGLQTWGAAASE